MPTGKPRVTITMTEEEFQRVEAYRFETRQKNQTQAILSLVRAGLKSLQKEPPPAPKGPREKQTERFMELYSQLSDDQRKLLEAVVRALAQQSQ